MFQPGSISSILTNALLSIIWLISIIVLILNNDYSLVFILSCVSFACFSGATILEFKKYREIHL